MFFYFCIVKFYIKKFYTNFVLKKYLHFIQPESICMLLHLQLVRLNLIIKMCIIKIDKIIFFKIIIFYLIFQVSPRI